MLEFLLFDVRFILQYAAFLALAAYAWRRGEAPDRLIGLIFVAAIAFEVIHHSVWGHGNSEHVNLVHTGLDLAMFAAFVPIAMRANRIYPLWILAAQLIAVAMHFERGVVASMAPLAYWLMIRVPSYLQMLAFALGLMAHRMRVQRGINASPWRRTLHP